ncbi:hypothetical protein EB796_000339 [Bugula neritina]|uniref:Uncharacterized protein n=1 Tax=Bugula neritina TaxID=10212 RepID=A0A7J7KTG6_BUGNE|nr:hypothetical protein EB796_000339 [Bugula neritina]
MSATFYHCECVIIIDKHNYLRNKLIYLNPVYIKSFAIDKMQHTTNSSIVSIEYGGYCIVSMYRHCTVKGGCTEYLERFICRHQSTFVSRCHK